MIVTTNSWKRKASFLVVGLVATLAAAGAQPREVKYGQAAALDRASHVTQVIDQAVNPAQLPAGYMGIVVGYLDDFGPVYKSYGKATVDGTVPLNEKTMFGVGSVTKLFAATLLAVANVKGLPLTTATLTLLPPQVQITPAENRYGIRLLDLADHHAGLPKNEGHLFNSVNDLYGDYAADPITCNPGTAELIHDCGCCDPIYMSLLGLAPTCGADVSNPVYSCPTHTPTQGPKGWVYSNLAFEVLGSSVATWLGYPNWNQANLQEITLPLNMPDTMPLESFGQSQIARAASHCSPATRTTNVNCQLLDWLPVGNAAGGLFSTAVDILEFLSYNAYGTTGTPPNSRLANALPIIHQTYEHSPAGGQELGWQTLTLPTGEVEHWKDGDNGPFHSWVAYVAGPLTRMVVVLDNSGANNADLSKIVNQVLVGTGPSISSVTTANGGSDIAQNTWVVIKGTNLVPANAPAGGFDWSAAPDFANGRLPTQVGGVSVTVNGKPAYVYFYCSAVTSQVCSSDQINVLTPLDSTTGPVQVIVANGTVSSAPFSANMKSIAPAFLQFTPQGYVVATHSNYGLLGPSSLYPGFSTPAKPGETVLVYAVGFGLPTSVLVNGSSTQSGSLPSFPDCKIGGATAAVSYSGLVSPGLYVLAITVPTGAANGDNPIGCTYNGAATPAGNLITVQQ